jgi:hypothetical protein
MLPPNSLKHHIFTQMIIFQNYNKLVIDFFHLSFRMVLVFNKSKMILNKVGKIRSFLVVKDSY